MPNPYWLFAMKLIQYGLIALKHHKSTICIFSLYALFNKDLIKKLMLEKVLTKGNNSAVTARPIHVATSMRAPYLAIRPVCTITPTPTGTNNNERCASSVSAAT